MMVKCGILIMIGVCGVIVQEVLNLYNDCSEDVKKLLMNVLSYLEKIDKDEFLKYCNNLCQLKRLCPEFTIRIMNQERSCFVSQDNTVIIDGNSLMNYCTFFHELTHAFHYYSKNFTIPDRFEEIIYNLRVNKRQDENFLTILKYIEEKYINEKHSLKNEQNEYINNVNDDNSEVRAMYIQVLQCLEDILDAVYRGKLHDQGIFYEKDMNNYCVNIAEISGHGEEYYSSKNNDYLEMIANYGAIRNSQFSEQMFKIMVLVLGEDLMMLLEKDYLEIMNLTSYDKIMDINDNSKKIR